MSSASLHRRLKHATRDVVFASPRLLAEYRRRHRWWWVPMVVVAMGIMAVVALFLPLLISLLELLDPETRAEMFRQPYGDRPGPEPLERFRPLAIFAPLWLMLWLLLVPTLRNYLWCGLHRGGIYSPLSDAQLTRGGWTKTYWLGALIFIGTAGWGWAFSLAMELEQRQWLLLMGLAALHAWLMVALTWLAATIIPRRWVSGSALAAIILMFGGTPALIYLGEILAPYPELSRQWELLAFLLPTGWVCGAINYAVLEHNPLGWLLLLPVAAVSLWAIVWRMRGLRLLEFIISFNGTCQPIFDRGFRDDREYGWSLLAETAPRESNAEQTRERVTKHILSGALWEPFQWPTDGFIERWVGRLLTDREQRALIFLWGGRPWWTSAWLMSWWLCLPALALQQTSLYLLGQHNEFVPIALIVLVAFSEFWAHGRQRAGTSLHPLFPVEPLTAWSALAKMLLVRVPMGLVPVASLLLVTSFADVKALTLALRLLLIVSVVGPGFIMSAMCMMLVNCRRSPHWQLVFVALLMPYMIGAIVGMLASVSWLATLTFLPLYAGGLALTLAITITNDRRQKWDYTDRLPSTQSRPT